MCSERRGWARDRESREGEAGQSRDEAIPDWIPSTRIPRVCTPPRGECGSGVEPILVGGLRTSLSSDGRSKLPRRMLPFARIRV